MNSYKRLRELDFLRGLAIILVLIRHSKIWYPFQNMGWIGVDLFFVLSGFLVSGLIFKEYQKYGSVDVKRFLIRRGFKIYPMFYLTALPYLALIYLKDGSIDYLALLGDLTFFQNYVSEWAYLYSAGWSLAVEEHFYFGLAFALHFFHSTSTFKQSTQSRKWFDYVVRTIVYIFVICFLLRVLSNYIYPDMFAKNFSMTHLRIDSLMSGVLLSYLYYFKKEKLQQFYFKNRKMLFLIAFLGLVWTPFFNPIPSFFVKTFGFTFLYISFSIILLSFLYEKRINEYLDRYFSRRVVNAMSEIGLASYSIYVIHLLVNKLMPYFYTVIGIEIHNIFNVFIFNTISVLLGIILTKYVENYFLKKRNQYFPSRSVIEKLSNKI